MKTFLTVYTLLVVGLLALGQTPTSIPNAASPVVVRFVAPPYPQAARDALVAGKTVTEISVDADGYVKSVRIVQSHLLFKRQVEDALKQWQFRTTNQPYKLTITISFEFDEQAGCTGETQVLADLPAFVRIRTSVPCVSVRSTQVK
jgi:TonB family protein